MTERELIAGGNAFLGMELGSTRIKAVLVGGDGAPLAQGSHTWENRLENGVWTYHLDDVWVGIQAAYADLRRDARERWGAEITGLAGLGVSAMMHGYLPFDREGRQLAAFRTWRNTMTEQAAAELTELFSFNIPQRWSIAHLYQAILNGEAHVKDIDFLATLAVYVHWKLTGCRIAGIGEASGMFPIDSVTKDYDAERMAAFDKRIAECGFGWKLRDILPAVKPAGAGAGRLTEAGARLLDPTGTLQPGAPLCPPEGDAGTGMVATDSVAAGTGNVSAGTSVFAMIVLEKALKKVHPEIDMVTTPSGKPVAMVHCNNCTSDLNAWVKLFGEFAEAMGFKADANQLFGTLYRKAMEADADLGGLLAYNYFSGEHITGFEEGRPLFARTPDSRFTLANFMRTHLYAALSSLKIGMNILLDEENVQVDQILGHGGLFKTKGVGQSIMAAAMNVPVAVMETAGEGGAWGIALLAEYTLLRGSGESLEDYLRDHVFAGMKKLTVSPDPEDEAGFDRYMEQFMRCIPAQKAAVEGLKA